MRKISKNRTLIIKYASKLRKTSEYGKLNTAPLIAMLPALLTGCMGIYEGGFECPAVTGVGCKSISEVNSMIERGELPKTPAEQLPSSKPEIWYAPRRSIPETSVTELQNKECRNREENLQEKIIENKKEKRDLNEKITL